MLKQITIALTGAATLGLLAIATLGISAKRKKKNAYLSSS
jgi:hypothetical protein